MVHKLLEGVVYQGYTVIWIFNILPIIYDVSGELARGSQKIPSNHSHVHYWDSRSVHKQNLIAKQLTTVMKNILTSYC